jgi:hypothetical protein
MRKTAIIATALALLALLAYSLERSAWLFGLFEQWSVLALAAAIVVELAAVALIVGAGALATIDASARAWANRALLAVLSVQALANLSAGYLRGGTNVLAQFGAGSRAAYAVAAVLWLVTNLAIPGLILCLSKLLERLIAAPVPVAQPAITISAPEVPALAVEHPALPEHAEPVALLPSFACPRCQAPLRSKQALGAAVKNKHCPECKGRP